MKKNFTIFALALLALSSTNVEAKQEPRFFKLNHDAVIPRNVKNVPVPPKVDKSERFIGLPDSRPSFYSIRRPHISVPTAVVQQSIAPEPAASGDNSKTLAEVFAPAQ